MRNLKIFLPWHIQLATTVHNWPADVPTRVVLRHGTLQLWPVPDAVYDLTVDFAKYHPAVFTDILFGAEFNEAIYHGVLKALYEGQFKRQLPST